MDPVIFDGGGSFEQMYWTGEESSRKAPTTSEQHLEITDRPDKKIETSENKPEEDKKRKTSQDFELKEGIKKVLKIAVEKEVKKN